MSSSTSTIIPKSLDRSNVLDFEDIKLEVFLGLKCNISIDEILKTVDKDKKVPTMIYMTNIEDFYNMMTKSLIASQTLSDKYYTPVYFSYIYDNNTIGGCAIWIMTLKDEPTIKFAYFYGIHRFPDAPKERFSSHLLLRKVITYCSEKHLAFICLPRPCMKIITQLWYSLGMTFNLENDTGNYLTVLKKQTIYDESYFSTFNNHTTDMFDKLPQVYETVKDINTNAKESIFDTASLTSTAGLLFEDNYNEAISKCDAYLLKQNSLMLKAGAIKKQKTKKQKTKTTKNQKTKKTKKQKKQKPKNKKQKI
jgi:hypothetical protein